MMATTKLLLTGCNGFVGAELVKQIQAQGFGFSVLSHAERMERQSLANFQGVTAVIHLAGRAHVMRETSASPLQAYMEANHDYALAVAHQAAQCGVKRFVYVSSVGVHGYQTVGDEFLTEASKCSPYSDYTVSKYQAELALKKLAQDSGLELVIVRPPLVYGAQVKANFLSLLKAVYKGLPLPLKAASNLRSMVYVGNLVDALIVCATHPEAAGETFLVSDNETVSVADLVAKLAQCMGKPSRSFSFPVSVLRALASLAGKGDAVERLTQPLVINSEKIRNILGWQPPSSLDAGLQQTVDWFLKEQQK